MLSSRNYVRDEQVINIGESIAPEPDLKNPNTRVYYHQVKGAQTHMPDGAAIQFLGGQFATANPEIIAFLDRIANKPGTQVYTKKEVAQQQLQEFADVAEEARVPTGNIADAAGKVKASTETVKQVEQAMKSETQLPSEADQAHAAAELKRQGITAPPVVQIPPSFVAKKD